MFFNRSASPIVPEAWTGSDPGAAAPGMFTRTVNCLMPAVESTVTPLEISPLLPARLSATSIGPFEPGAMRHGCEGSLATVQPQDVRTPLTNTSDEETLVSQKVNFTSVSPTFAECSFVSESHLIAFGSAAATAGAVAVTAGGTATTGETTEGVVLMTGADKGVVAGCAAATGRAAGVRGTTLMEDDVGNGGFGGSVWAATG